jgi:hypothetical protein
LRADRGDLRNDRGNFRNVDQDDRHGGWQDQRNIGKPVAAERVNGAKPGITSTTLANNAAENNKKVQTNQKLQKAWYHVW